MLPISKAGITWPAAAPNAFQPETPSFDLQTLENDAAQGQRESIDLLINIAFGTTSESTQAENIIFDFFSGAKPSDNGTDKNIQKACSDLYENNTLSKISSDNLLGKFKSPSKLLYIVGSAVTGTEKKKEISTIFAKSSTDIELDLWLKNRLITGDEINKAIQATAGTQVCVNAPIPLSIEEINHASIAVSEAVIRGDFLTRPEYFPINIENHWVLLGIHNDSDLPDTRKAFVFSSTGTFDSTVRNHFLDAIDIAGVTKENLEFIETELQKNVPNGCGIFVTEAIGITSGSKDPGTSLRNFANDFLKSSSDDQEKFNVQKRRQIYRHSLAD